MTQPETHQSPPFDRTTQPIQSLDQQGNKIFEPHRLPEYVPEIAHAVTSGVIQSEALSSTKYEKGISHVLSGDAARQDQLQRLRVKITDSQAANSSVSSAKQKRWRREEAFLVKAINKNSGGLPSQSVDIVTF
ncbi:MAG: hypothetical protein RLZZ455_1017 [Candidatus Parcubacteria bacterium]|jgi:hypothetical protein